MFRFFESLARPPPPGALPPAPPPAGEDARAPPVSTSGPSLHVLIVGAPMCSLPIPWVQLLFSPPRLVPACPGQMGRTRPNLADLARTWPIDGPQVGPHRPKLADIANIGRVRSSFRPMDPSRFASPGPRLPVSVLVAASGGDIQIDQCPPPQCIKTPIWLRGESPTYFLCSIIVPG